MELKFDEPVIFIGDGPVDQDVLKKYKGLPIIAVDGGANAASRLEMDFDYICGDMDSVVTKIIDETEPDKIIRLEDQDKCDFAKALEIVSAPKIYAFGFMGGRMDHSYAALLLLSMHSDKNIELVGKNDRAFVWPSGTHRDMRLAQRVSFVSYGDTHVNVSFGLKYLLDGLTIAPSHMSLSNEADEKEVAISYDGAPLVAIVEC